MNIRCEIYESIRAASIRPALQAIDADAPNLYQTWPWFDNLEANGLPRDVRPICVAVNNLDSGRPLVWPLALHSRGTAAVYGPVLGALSTYYSSLFGPVGASQDCDLHGCRTMLRILKQLGGAADVIDLQPLDTDAVSFNVLVDALRAEGYLTHSYFCFGNWHLPSKGLSFEDFHAALPSRIRNTIHRNRKKLDKSGPWSMELHREAGPAMEAAIDSFVGVYNRSWKIPEPFPEFVPGLCRMAAQEGWLRLGVLKVGSVPVAAQLWLVRSGRAMIYKLAYDEAYSGYSPGSVLSMELFRSMLDDESVEDIDYLTGDDRYKQDWMSQRRERRGIVAFRRASLRGMLSAAKHTLGLWLRNYRIGRMPEVEAQSLSSETKC